MCLRIAGLHAGKHLNKANISNRSTPSMYLALFFPTEIEASHYYSGICTLARIHRVFGYTKKADHRRNFIVK